MAVLATGHNAIGSTILDIETFSSLEEGHVLVSPMGMLFVFEATIDEFEPSGHETEENKGDREFHIIDSGKTRRRIIFDEAGISEYGVLIGCYGPAMDSTGIQKKIGKEFDPEHNDFVDYETGWKSEAEQ